MKAVIFVKRSERFPGKHSVLVNGVGLTEGLAVKLESLDLFDDVVIFSKDSSFQSRHGRIEEDSSKGTIVNSVFEAVSKFGDIFAFAGDMPDVCGDLVRSMVDSFTGDSICPVSAGGRIQPLHCIYSSGSLTTFMRYIETGGKSLHGFVESNAILIRIPAGKSNCFYNINYPEDLKKYRAPGNC
jgi:molybdopterin-guanine dinucleotide biosynthesis protein A